MKRTNRFNAKERYSLPDKESKGCTKKVRDKTYDSSLRNVLECSLTNKTNTIQPFSVSMVRDCTDEQKRDRINDKIDIQGDFQDCNITAELSKADGAAHLREAYLCEVKGMKAAAVRMFRVEVSSYKPVNRMRNILRIQKCVSNAEELHVFGDSTVTTYSPGQIPNHLHCA
ncbi:hypothetical protein BWQ96_00200 [Gracilariopsis chorda]|uniref:Uncharacterized protein n=1 Tax=Gracilariopsis chorda TaxID=448386 RepID=A0A2V3JD43_9FLOR|nr:hypothetical protein BWQ96_00200 [Gracilariopsis chorda]|eukprot:PXF50040.1 hypothetical protein BWQ96_00200 [Gracilariopsis chorda]